MAESVNPEMLVVARESKGLTQSEFAEKVGLSQGKVSKLEAGLLMVSSEDLVSICRVLDFPKEFFLQTDRVYGFGTSCFYHRKRMRMPVSELRQIQAKLNLFRFHIIRLLRTVEIEANNEFVRMDVDEHGGPESIARAVRQQWGLPMGPVRSVINAVEHAGAIIYAWDFGTRNLDAISQVAPGCPPLIFVNSTIPADRLRFTLMHEVGHIIMHQVPTDTIEEQSDRFAAEFLMPEMEIKSKLRNLRLQQLPALKTEWKVSMAAIVKRAFDLHQITERQYRYLYTQLSSQGWRTNEPVEVEETKPTVFPGMLDAHFSSCGFTVTELSKALNCSEEQVRDYVENLTPRLGLRVVR